MILISILLSKEYINNQSFDNTRKTYNDSLGISKQIMKLKRWILK